MACDVPTLAPAIQRSAAKLIFQVSLGLPLLHLSILLSRTRGWANKGHVHLPKGSLCEVETMEFEDSQLRLTQLDCPIHMNRPLKIGLKPYSHMLVMTVVRKLGSI